MSTNKPQRRFWRHPLRAGLVLGVLAATGILVMAATVSQTSFSHMFGEINTVGADMSVSSTDIAFNQVAASATGATSGAAIEMATGASGSGNTGLTKANWYYQAVIEETGIDSVTSGTYQAELFLDGTTQGVIFFTQGTANAAATEGVTLTWDIGADLPNGDQSYRLEITSA